MLKSFFTKLSHYPRLRVLLLIAILVVVFIVLLNVFNSNSDEATPSVPPSKINTVQPSMLQKGYSQEEQQASKQRYEQLADSQHKERMAKIKASGETFFNNIFKTVKDDNKATTEKKDENPAIKQVKETKPQVKSTGETVTPEEFYEQEVAKSKPDTTKENTSSSSRFIQQIRHEQAAAANKVRQAVVSKRAEGTVGDLKGAIDGTIKSMGLPKQVRVFGVNTPKAPKAPEKAPPPQTVIKAGNILFAVLDVGLNSDQPGPVLATVVAGKFKNAKLMGTFVRKTDRLVIQFNSLSLPDKAHSIGISAYAIDADTARTALATGVDNHYLLRYGGLMAAALLNGFGNAFASAQNPCGNSTTCYIFDHTVQKPSFKEAMFQGLGQVGQQLGQQAANKFNTPPTVTLKQGLGIGVLFMSDVSISNSVKTYNS